MAIFNDTDYAYKREDKVISTLSIEIPQYIYDRNYIKTIIRGDGKYSFYTWSKYYPYSRKSYSSEIGIENCGGFLITDKEIGDRYIGWRSGNIVSFKNCSDWQTLERGYGSSSSYYVFDVVFQKDN